MPIRGGRFWRSLTARDRPFPSFLPIGRFGLSLGRQIPERVQGTPGRGAEFGFRRFPPDTHQAVAANRRLCLTRAPLLVEFPILGRDVWFLPIHRSAPGSRRGSALNETQNAGADRFRQSGPRGHDRGQIDVFGVQKRQAKRQDTFAAFRNCLSNCYLRRLGQGFESPWG